MTISQVEASTRKVRRAQSELDKLLEDGADATKARADLVSAQVELEAAEEAARERAAEAEQRIESEAAELTAALKAEVAAGVAGILQRIGSLPAPQVEVRWAVGVARARRELAALRTDVDVVRERLAGQQTRLSGLKGDRQAVIERRLAGDLRDTDAGTMALLTGDIEGLTDLASRTAAELKRLEAELSEATATHAQAEKRWTAAVEGAWCDALADLALIAESVILEASEAMRVQGGDRRRWSPSVPLENHLHGKIARAA